MNNCNKCGEAPVEVAENVTLDSFCGEFQAVKLYYRCPKCGKTGRHCYGKNKKDARPDAGIKWNKENQEEKNG